MDDKDYGFTIKVSGVYKPNADKSLESLELGVNFKDTNEVNFNKYIKCSDNDYEKKCEQLVSELAYVIFDKALERKFDFINTAFHSLV